RMPAGGIAKTRLMPRSGARPLVTAGMLLSAAAMVMLTGVGVDSSYVTDILPGLLVMGLGLGLVFAPAMSTATLGVDRADAGVASALVNTGQQIGGSIGTALLSTLAAGAASSFASRQRPSPALAPLAAGHRHTTAFLCSAAIVAIGGLVSWALLSRGAPQVDEEAAAELVFAH